MYRMSCPFGSVPPCTVPVPNGTGLESGRKRAASKCDCSGTHPVASLKTPDKGIVRVILYHLECCLRPGCARHGEYAEYLVPSSSARVSFWSIVLILLAYSKSSLTSGTGRQPDRQTESFRFPHIP